MEIKANIASRLFMCHNCKDVYGAFRIRYELDGMPIEDDIDIKYCPVCGQLVELIKKE